MYCYFEGDMDHILETVMCCTFEDEPRFHDILRRWIEDGVVEPYDFVSKETRKRRRKRQARWEKEASEAEEMKKEVGTYSGDEGVCVCTCMWVCMCIGYGEQV